MKKPINEIKEEFLNAGIDEIKNLSVKYLNDERKGVRRIAKSFGRKAKEYEEELARLKNMHVFEDEYASCGLIAGVDEAGRGPLAGPVAAGAVILPPDCSILYLDDSKKLSASKREKLYDEITKKSIAWGLGVVSNERIDEINILQATYEAMAAAIEDMGVRPDIALVDAVTIPGAACRQVGIVKGDEKSVSIAAASIVAKVSRDRIMTEMDRLYPEYGFASHKGYGTKMHIEAIKKYGTCPIHRKTFVKNFV